MFTEDDHSLYKESTMLGLPSGADVDDYFDPYYRHFIFERSIVERFPQLSSLFEDETYNTIRTYAQVPIDMAWDVLKGIDYDLIKFERQDDYDDYQSNLLTHRIALAKYLIDELNWDPPTEEAIPYYNSNVGTLHS